MIDPDAGFGSKADKTVSARRSDQNYFQTRRAVSVLCAGSGHNDASFDYPVVAAALPRLRMASASIRQTQLPEIVDHTVES